MINQIQTLCDEEESLYNGNLNFAEIMTKLNKVRATEFNDWRDIGFALINLNYRKIISRGQLYDLFDLFSLKQIYMMLMELLNFLILISQD